MGNQKDNCVQPTTKLCHLIEHPPGDRAFQAAAPMVWNDLPADLRSITNLKVLRRNLQFVILALHILNSVQKCSLGSMFSSH